MFPGCRTRRERPLGVGAWHGRRKWLIYDQLHVAVSKSRHKEGSRDSSPQSDGYLCLLSEGGLTSDSTCFRSFRWLSWCTYDKNAGESDFEMKMKSRLVSLLRFVHMFCGSLCTSWCSGIPQGTLCGARLCPAKKHGWVFNLWSKIQGSLLRVRKRALDLESKGSSISFGSITYKLCDFGEITLPFCAYKNEEIDQTFSMSMPNYKICLWSQSWRFLF